MDSLTASLASAELSAPSPADLVAAFGPRSDAHRRTLAQIHLAQTGVDTALRARLAALLSSSSSGSDFGDEDGIMAALRLVAALYGSRPDEAHALLLPAHDGGPLDGGLVVRSIDDDRLGLALAEVLCAASGHGPSRKELLERNRRRAPVQASKIVEVGSEEDGASAAGVPVGEWLRTWVDRAELQDGQARVVGLLCALTLEKMRRGGKEKEADNKAVESKEEEGEEGDEETLYQLARRFLVVGVATKSDEKSDSDERARMASVEALTYLSLGSAFRQRVADDTDLLRGLVVAVLRACQAKPPDTALQYGVATVLLHLVAFKPVATAEERQMARLRRMANAEKRASQKQAQANEEEDGDGEHNELLEAPAVRARINRAVECGAVAAITAMSTVRPLSSALTATAAQAMLAMTTPQDRAQRGRIVQQGGARALFLLLASSSSSSRTTKDDGATKRTAAQSLAHLLIDLDPRLVLRDDATSAVAPLGALFMSAASSTLQRFEACLALTNLASLSEDVCASVARFTQPLHAVLPATGGFRGAGTAESKDGDKASIGLLALLDERLFFEDNAMARRACVELACNLAAGPHAFSHWSGEALGPDAAQPQQQQHDDDSDEERRQRWTHLVVALCAYAPTASSQADQGNSGSGETTKAMRLAAGGLLAMLSESSAVCARIAKLRTTTVNLLVRLVWPGVPPRIREVGEVGDGGGDDGEEEEEEEDRAGERDEWDEGLALRGLTILANVAEHAPTCRGSLLVGAGLVDALEALMASSQVGDAAQLVAMAKQVYDQLQFK
ncbi:hypothetical protein FA10DRAFT_301017 [Acaromyces ingoldii]|uniref:UNC-45/Cro1/She4 central domain-containing protein n=1 Tax=Acaromyces ingoldii TaxID=215250 RepID=A0A316YSM1_9BASI|nr:hypothetical protein FA10DRAFT_301017 [Acaromyces ingoldii]PWN92550.1 hypothetical protein FA10DRAFT_301017 [Acaromyces ingoldii]